MTFPGDRIIKKALVLYLEHNAERFCGCVGCCDIRVRLFPDKAVEYFIAYRGKDLSRLSPYGEDPRKAHEARRVIKNVGAFGQLRLAIADFLEALGEALSDKADRIRQLHNDNLSPRIPDA